MNHRIMSVAKAILIALCLSRSAQANEGSLRGAPLPNWEAPWEKEAAADSKPAKFNNKEDWGIARAAGAQPPSDIRLPAEYEPTDAVVMSYKAYPYILQQLSIEIAKADAKVLMVNGPASLGGVPSDKYFPISLYVNSVWARDFGPVGVLQNNGSEAAVIDTRYRHYQSRIYDDNIPCSIAQQEGMPCYTTDLILDGGNLMSDGAGTIFMTTRTYDWNSYLPRSQVDQLLKTYFGADTIHAFDYAKDSSGEPADGTGHIDMFAKILFKCVVLVASTNDVPYRQPLEAAASYFRMAECAPGQKYTVYRIPAWVGYSSTWYTYTNSLIVNDVVIIPSYRNEANDQAVAIYRSAVPSKNIVSVNTDESIDAGGSVHCLTRQIPRV